MDRNLHINFVAGAGKLWRVCLFHSEDEAWWGGVSGLQRCLGPDRTATFCSAPPSAGGCTRPPPVPGLHHLAVLLVDDNAEEFLGVWRSSEGRQETPGHPCAAAAHSAPLRGAGFSLGGRQVLLPSPPRSAFVMITRCSHHIAQRHIPYISTVLPPPCLSLLPHLPRVQAPSPPCPSSTGSPTYLRKPKPSRGAFGPFLPSLGNLGEGASTAPPKGQLSEPGCWPVHSTAGM